ncbi:hypothetical protein [Halovenus salina]|uniref:Uncharacterized protein n=1 Tax=Halovenus salina TaxID=1510225 RepID=A0ABD5W7G3_9EURY|nr:hypothetical protein [Halovenus salina]
MPDTEQIHDLFKGEDNFEELVQGMDNEQSMDKLISSVETVGRELREELDEEVIGIDDISIGWMLVTWEGHHTAARLEGRSFADALEEA